MSARLGPVKRADLVAVLRKNGLELIPGRGKGSHDWYEDPKDSTRHSAVPDRREIFGDLLKDIYQQAGKTRKKFLQRLSEV